MENTEKKLIEFIEHIGQINEKIEERLQGIEFKLKVELPKQPEPQKQSWEDITTLKQVVDIYEQKYSYKNFLCDTQKDLLRRATLSDCETRKAAAYFQLSIIARVLNDGKEETARISWDIDMKKYTTKNKVHNKFGEIIFDSEEIAEHVITHFKDILDVLYL